MDAIDAESRLKAQIRGDLPSAAFARDGRRLWLLGALVAAIGALSTSVAALPMPWPMALVASCAIGGLYASLFFLGHDVAHGAVIASRRAQTGLMYVTFLICCTSPHFFRYWHNHAHHHHTNIASHDPDMFGTLEQFERKRLSKYVARFAPGSGHWLSVVYLFTFFTAHAQGVLWCNSKTPPFDGMNRLRAKGETLAMAACWVAIAVVGGLWATCFVVVIPMLIANFILMSFIVTNHMLRPLTTGRGRTLETTMSVTTSRLVDRVFLNFSHHVEHHLFPGVSSRFYPAIRRSLQRHARDSYLAPPHLTALRAVFSTPRLYADRETLIDPSSRARTSLLDIETSLRHAVRGRGRIAPMPS